MFEVVIGNSLSKQVATLAKANELVAKAKALFGAEITWVINEIIPLYDAAGQPSGSKAVRVASSAD